MGYINNTTLTEAGERLLAKAETGTELKYTRIMVGDGQMTSDQTLLTMTTVISPVISVPITFCEPIFEGPTMAKVGGTFDNTQITTTFMYREVGLFALDPDDGEILYAYGNAGTQAEPIAPATDGGLIVERTPIILAIIGRAKNITAAIASGANVSNYEFNQYKNEISNTFVTINNTLDSKVDRMDKAEYFNIPLQTGVKPAYQAIYWISQTGEFGIVFNTISTAAVKTGTALGFLPEGARPAVRTPVPGSMNINNSTRLSCSIDILPNGQMLLVYAGDAIAAGNTWDVVVPPVYIPIGG